MDESRGHPCPCCGYRTLPGPSPTDEICPVCFWQDDFVDNQDTDVLGPNRVRLSVARDNYARTERATALRARLGTGGRTRPVS